MSFTPDDILARVLYCDDDVLILNKPPGLPVHAGCKIQQHLEELLPAVSFDRPEPPRLAHRLDKDTSGCLVLGRLPEASTALGRLFLHKKVDKIYWAVVEGEPAEPAGTVDASLLKLKGELCARMEVHPDGKSAVTDWRVVATAQGRAWLELLPRTGRTHQLRVHCATLGTPIVGDFIYGIEPRPPVQPLHLHARAIRLHLTSGPVTAEAPLPTAMDATFAALGFDPAAAGASFTP